MFIAQRFTLDGSTFTVVGYVIKFSRTTCSTDKRLSSRANAYWVGLMAYSVADMNQAFADIAATGATTVRTWGFNDVTAAIGGGWAYYQVGQSEI